MFYRLVIFLLITSVTLRASSIKETELEVTKWLAIEVEKSQAAREWAQECILLESEIVLLQNQLKDNDKKIKDQLKIKAGTDKKVKQVKLEDKKQVQNMLDLTLIYNKELTLFKKELLPFPFLLAKPLIDKLLVGNEASLSVRFSTLQSLVLEAQGLTKQWHLVEQKLKIENRTVLCQVLYAGISKGFAITRDGSQAFVGQYQKGKWLWSTSTETSAIDAAIKNFQNGGISKSELPFLGGHSE